MSRVIEIRPFRGGSHWFEAQDVAPYWRGEQAKQDAIRLRHGSRKVECGLSTLRGINSCKPSVPRLGDSRRGENPYDPTPHDGCQSDRDYSNYGASLQMKIELEAPEPRPQFLLFVAHIGG